MEDEILECPFKKRKIEESLDDPVNSIARHEINSISDENKSELLCPRDEEEPIEDSGEG